MTVTKLGSYIDIIEKGIKDLNENISNEFNKLSKIATIDSTKDKLLTLSNKNSIISNTSNVYMTSAGINTSKNYLIKNKQENSNLNELYKYFQDNEMNFFNFCEFFKNFQNDLQYLFVLVTSNKNIIINREPVSNYEMTLVNFILN